MAPSIKHHARLLNNHGGWIPKNPEALKDWIHKIIGEIEVERRNLPAGVPHETFGVSAVIQEFQQTIETDPEIYMYFNQMFEQVPPTDVKGRRQISNYKTLMLVFNYFISRAPRYETIGDTDVIGVPIYAVLDPLMNTPAGANAFINPRVNAQFKKMFDVWSRLLVSPESTNVITTSEHGWLSQAAIQDLDAESGGAFQNIFVCDPSQPHWGFTSWDHFFTRVFRTDGPNPPRPVQFPDDDKFINAACDSTVYRIARNVKALDEFWIKGQPYSLNHMLNNDPLASQFAGGTVLQAFLSPFNYHRWNSPVNGRIIEAYVVPGTYYAAVPDGEGPGALIRSQAYETALAARALIFIESDNPTVGLMCFIGVGMAEVSSCELSVSKNDVVKKGDELGMFHFGGSTHCLVFRPLTNITFIDTVKEDAVIRVKSVIAHVD